MRILASLCLCAAGLGAQPNDWTIVPGERIGPITGSRTIVSLRQQFGAANVREAELPTAKPDRGFAYGLENGPAAIVYPESPSRALAVYWGKGETAGHPEGGPGVPDQALRSGERRTQRKPAARASGRPARESPSALRWRNWSG